MKIIHPGCSGKEEVQWQRQEWAWGNGRVIRSPAHLLELPASFLKQSLTTQQHTRKAPCISTLCPPSHTLLPLHPELRKWIQWYRAACIFTIVDINTDLTLSLSSWQMWSWWMDWHWKEAPTLPTREREEKLRCSNSSHLTCFTNYTCLYIHQPI